MATQRQKKLAKLVVENSTLDKPLNGGELLEKVSYSKGLQKQPSRVIEAKGVQQELDKLGFTEDNAMIVVSDIMLNPEAQDNNRLKASEMIFKVKGTFAPEKKAIVNLNVDINNPKASKIAQEYEDKLKTELLVDEEDKNK